MKLFQKTCPLVGILLLCGGILLGAEKRRSSQRVLTKKEVLKSIKKASKKVFPSDKNLLDEENKNTQKWYKMLNSVRSYVKKNAGENEDLLDAFALCWNASRKLINVLTNAYDTFLAVFERPEDVSSRRIGTVSRGIIALIFESINLTKMQEKLENMSYSEKKKDVKEVLISLIEHTRNAIDRLMKDHEVKEEILFSHGLIERPERI